MLYLENEKSKTLMAPEYTWFLDKNSGIALSWGMTKKDDPKYSIWSPETVIVKMGKDYKCDPGIWNKLLNVEMDESPKNIYENGFISTIHIIEIDAPDGLTPEIIKTMKWLKERRISVLIRQLQNQLDMRSVMDLTMKSVDFVSLEADDLSSLKGVLDLLILNKINVKVTIKNKPKEDIIKFFKVCPKGIEVDCYVEDSDEEEIGAAAVNSGILGIVLYSKNGKNQYPGCLFSCVYDFISNEVYFEIEKDIKFKMNKIQSVTDYWNAPKTEKIRKKLLKNK